MSVRAHKVAKAAYECVAARRDERQGDGRRRDLAGGPAGADGQAAPGDGRSVDSKKYGALAHKLPGMILENGLAQATGFLLAKGKPEHLAVIEDLRTVLHDAGTTTASDGAGLHQEIIASDLDRTVMLTRRSLEAGACLKRYVQGVLRVDATGERPAGDEPPAGGRQA